ncbi:MAG: hypothetical protein AAGB12_08185 [Pseudomonadota bacterium]
MFYQTIVKIFLLIGFLFSSSLLARFYPPQLEPIPVAGNALKSIMDHSLLAIDDQHRLCIVEANRGLYCYDGNHLAHMADDALGLVTLDHRDIHRIVFSIKNRLYQLHQGKIDLFESQLHLEKQENITALYPVDNASFLVATNLNVYYYQDTTIKKLTAVPHNLYIYFIRKNDESRIELATSKGIIDVDLLTRKMRYRLKENKVYYLYKNYALTAQGIYQENKKISDKVFFHASQTISKKILLSGPQGLCYLQNTILCSANNTSGKVYSTLTDQYGNLWAATNKGIMFAPFAHVEYINQQTGLSNSNVVALVAHQQNLYVGTDQGINILNLSNGKISPLTVTANDKVTALLVAEDGYLWVGTQKGLYRYHIDTRRKEYSLLKNKLVTWIVNYHNKIIVSTYNKGVFVFDTAGNLIHDNIESYTQKITKIVNCHDNLYLGTEYKGIKRFDNAFQISHYTNKANHAILACYRDKIVTAGSMKQLKFFDLSLKEKKPKQLTASINSLLPDKDILWVFHHKKISQWQADKLIKNYKAPLETLYHNIGLRHLQWLLAGSPDGLAIIDTQSLQAYNPPEAQVLLNTSVDNTSGALVIEPRLSNLVSILNNQNILYRTSNNDNFSVIHANRSLVFPQGLDEDSFVEFKGVHGVQTTASVFYQAPHNSGLQIFKHQIFHLFNIMTFIALLIVLAIIIGLTKENTRAKKENKKLIEKIKNLEEEPIIQNDISIVEEKESKESCLDDEKNICKDVTKHAKQT